MLLTLGAIGGALVVVVARGLKAADLADRVGARDGIAELTVGWPEGRDPGERGGPLDWTGMGGGGALNDWTGDGTGPP